MTGDGAMNRRGFLRLGVLAALAPASASLLAAQAQQSAQSQPPPQPDSLPGAGAAGSLRDPYAVGRSRTPTTQHDNDEAIKQIELKLACSCGCTLDVFTCRTTDFTCTYSPAMHREVVTLWEQGKTPQQIIDAFVGEYGEKVLMAPKPAGFNLAGYLVPGAVIAAAGAGLTWFLRRRMTLGRLAAAPAHEAVGDAATTGAAPVPPAVDASPEELERLRRALAEVED